MDTIKDAENQGVSTNKVYYFSGTGNSYYVAKRISDTLNREFQFWRDGDEALPSSESKGCEYDYKSTI